MKNVLLASASLLGLGLSLAPQSASADSLSDLKLQMSIIESQVQTLQSHAARETPDDRAALADVQREVAALKTQMAQVQAQQLAPAQVQIASAPAPMRQSRAPLTALTGGTGPIPLIGGIPIVNSPRGAFFVAGTIDGGLRLDSGTHTHSVFGVQSGLMRASRLTLEGYLNLAEGWRVTGIIEGGFNIATGTGSSNPPNVTGGAFTFGRYAAVGIGNDKYGYLDFGRQYSPIWAVSAAGTSEPYAGNYLGGIGAIDPALARSSSRVSNAITYSYRYSWEGMLDPSPAHGLGFAALFAPGTGTGDAAPGGVPLTSGQQFGASISYGTKHFWLGYGYEQQDGMNANITAALPYYTPPPGDKPVLVLQSLDGSYLLRFARVFVGINSADNGRKLPVTSGGVDTRDWYVGATIPTFVHQSLRLMYGTTYDLTETRGRYSTVQASYEYDLTKLPGSALYLEGGLIANNKHSAVTFNGAGNTLANGLLTANGTTPDYGATGSTVATGIRFIF